MIGNMWNDDLGEMYRQRARWFLLLGGLLGGIITLAAAFGFWLEQWGRHMGGGPGEDAQGLATGLAVALVAVVVVIALVLWRSAVLFRRAREYEESWLTVTPHGPSAVTDAVAAWTASALGAGTSSSDRPGVQPPQRPAHPEAESHDTGLEAAAEPPAALASELTLDAGSDLRTLAEMMHSVEEAGIQTDILWSTVGSEGEHVHVVVRDDARALDRLEEAGLRVLESRTVVIVQIEDRPGSAADLLRRLGDAGLRVSAAQLASSTRLIVTADDPAGVVDALS